MKYVVDIDGTIFHSYVNLKGQYEIRDANEKLIEKLNKLYEEGNEIIYHTARHWNYLKRTLEQLKEYGVKYTTLMMGKPVGDFYIDDKGILPKDFLKKEDIQ